MYSDLGTNCRLIFLSHAARIDGRFSVGSLWKLILLSLSRCFSLSLSDSLFVESVERFQQPGAPQLVITKIQLNKIISKLFLFYG